ncbi:hypothetical protein PV327_006825, partial [Microctonus hyperodae]
MKSPQESLDASDDGRSSIVFGRWAFSTCCYTTTITTCAKYDFVCRLYDRVLIVTFLDWYLESFLAQTSEKADL